MTYKGTIRLDRRDRVAELIFATPDRMNAISEDRLSDLERALDELEADDELGGLIISGEGRAFCVGLDLDVLKVAFNDVAYFGLILSRLNQVINRIEKLPFPVIAAVNGFARAGGFEIALGCDFILIADTARIGDNHAQVGVMPGGGATARLPRRIGMQRAKDLIFTARWLTGEEAAEYGLALRCVPASSLMDEARAFAQSMASKPRITLATIKKRLDDCADLPIAAGVALEVQAFLEYHRASDVPQRGFWQSINARPTR